MILKRKNCCEFCDQPIEENDVLQILECAKHAPSGHN